ncbi:hypothetical protein AGMMS49928_15380 [Spirochaetia bacterium]|nr:hypothetical protein AGMMS49928_15380 [Spirochaetia bacterium]
MICPSVKKKALLFLMIVFLPALSIPFLHAQDFSDEYADLPRAFRNITLGMQLDELKNTLTGDDLFLFRGDRDVSYLPAREESLVEIAGASFLKRAFFQLRGGELFIMAYSLNTALVDHYSVFMAFVKKYGQPLTLDPKEAVWETDDTRISIERPLTVKYIDKTIFNDILDESRAKKADSIRAREDFLNEF